MGGRRAPQTTSWRLSDSDLHSRNTVLYSRMEECGQWFFGKSVDGIKGDPARDRLSDPRKSAAGRTIPSIRHSRMHPVVSGRSPAADGSSGAVRKRAHEPNTAKMADSRGTDLRQFRRATKRTQQPTDSKGEEAPAGERTKRSQSDDLQEWDWRERSHGAAHPVRDRRERINEVAGRGIGANEAIG